MLTLTLGVKRKKYIVAAFFVAVVVLGIIALIINSALNPPVTWVPIDYNQALANNLIRAEIRGQGLETMSVNLTSNTNESYKIILPSGTIFVPLSPNRYTQRIMQDMVLTDEQVFYVKAHSETQLFVAVASAKMKLGTPGWADYFAVSKNQTDSDLIKLLNTTNFSNATARVKQFAIWTITDNPTRDEYAKLITIIIEPRPTFGYNNPYQNDAGTGPSDEEMNTIKTLFENAGISTDKYKAFGQAGTVPTPSP